MDVDGAACHLLLLLLPQLAGDVMVRLPREALQMPRCRTEPSRVPS